MLFRDCNYPKVITFLLGTQALFFLGLFGNFYHKSYVANAKDKKTEAIKQNGVNGVNGVNGTANHTTEINSNHINGKISNGISDRKHK